MNQNFLVLIFFITLLCSCKKDDIHQITSTNIAVNSLVMIEQARCDGKILLESSEAIEGNPTSAAGNYSGVFYDADNEFTAAGSVKINDNIHLNPVENGKRNLLSGVSSFDLLGKQNKVTFMSSNPDFKSFEDNIYFPKKLLVKTNMDNTDFIEKKKDFKIEWQSDESNPDGKIYLTICALGRPCKLVEINDQLGTYTVNSSELSFLQTGDKVFLNVFRGNFKKVTIKQKNILVGAYLYANMSGIIVK